MRGLIILAYIIFPLVSYTQESDQKLKITPLKGNYFVFTTYQHFKGNKVSANGMYIVTKEGVVLIDTPWDSTQFQPLLDSIKKKHGKEVVMCIATHSHEDRSAGLEYYAKQGIKTYTSAMTDSISIAHHEKRAQFHFDKDTTFEIGGSSFRTIYAGAGHTRDNIVIWSAKDKILFGGCLIKSTEASDLGYIKEADLKAWSLALQKIKQKFPKPAFIITGHQDWKDKRSIEHTLELLTKTEKK